MRGLCSSTHRSQMAESLDPTYTGIDISFDQLQQYGQEVMSEHPFPQSCTEDAWGLTTEWSGIMSAFDDLMRIETSGGQTDGMMQPSQCASTWAPDSGSRSRRRAQATRVMAQRRERRERRLGPGFFDFTGNTVHLQVNNVDGTCMAGDSMFDMLHNRRWVACRSPATTLAHVAVRPWRCALSLWRRCCSDEREPMTSAIPSFRALCEQTFANPTPLAARASSTAKPRTASPWISVD